MLVFQLERMQNNKMETKYIDDKIKGSMELSLLNRIYEMKIISSSTYMELKRQILAEYQLKLL